MEQVDIERLTKGSSSIPWWAYMVPQILVGAPADATEQEWLCLGTLGTVALFDTYEVGLFQMLQVQLKHEFGIAEDEIAHFGAILKMGNLAAPLAGILTDQIGRLPLLRSTIVFYTLFSVLTAFSFNQVSFLVCQMISRVAAGAEAIVAAVAVIEVFEPRYRGWAIGALQAMAGLSVILMSIGFSMVEVLPGGWRSLYLFGALPLTWSAYLRRNLHESPMFLEQQKQKQSATEVPPDSTKICGGVVAFCCEALAMFRMFPLRMSAAIGLSVARNIGYLAVFFGSSFLQERAGFSPSTIAFIGMAQYVFSLPAPMVAGMLADRFGRKPMHSIFFVINTLLTTVYFQLEAYPITLVAIDTITNYTGPFAGVSGAAINIEIFPTSHRATASSIVGVTGEITKIFVLTIEPYIYRITGSHYTSASMFALGGLAVPFFVALLPESAGRHLKDVEKVPDGQQLPGKAPSMQ